jgi:RNA polymerase sigma-70 factor, ECF subfamily
MSVGQGQLASVVQAGPDFVARIASGDREAERDFISRYERGVRVLVRRHCRPNDPIADDLAQDVLSRVLERLRVGAIEGAAALPAYIRSVIVHATSAEYRGRRPTAPVAAIDEMAAADNPAERTSSQQLAALTRTLLEQLPVARDREILKRFYLDEQDKDDVCRELGIDGAHFHRVVFRARERFRELLMRAGVKEIER